MSRIASYSSSTAPSSHRTAQRGCSQASRQQCRLDIRGATAILPTLVARRHSSSPYCGVEEGSLTTLHEQLALLRGYNKAIQERDPKLAEEVRDRMASGEMVTESAAPLEEIDRQVELESIAMRKERPVLAIKENVTQLVFIDQADSEIWGERLKKAKSVLDAAIPAIGRVDLRGAPLGFVGTAWLVAENVIVTNRHVASEFAMRRGDGFTFKVGTAGPMSSAVDFLQEIDNPAKLVFN